MPKTRRQAGEQLAIPAPVAICNLAWPSPTFSGFNPTTPLQAPYAFPKLEQLLLSQKAFSCLCGCPCWNVPFLISTHPISVCSSRPILCHKGFFGLKCISLPSHSSSMCLSETTPLLPSLWACPSHPLKIKLLADRWSCLNIMLNQSRHERKICT